MAGTVRAASQCRCGAQAVAALGGPWLSEVRFPSGLTAVVVPSGCRVRRQPQRWMAVRWWKAQKGQVAQAVGRRGIGR